MQKIKLSLNNIKKFLILANCFFLIITFFSVIFSLPVFSADFTDDTETELNFGTCTIWSNIFNSILSNGCTTAGGDSYIKDALVNASWNNFSWLPLEPYKKPLPNNKITESYSYNSVSMQNNYVLYHLEESGTSNLTFSDTSGDNNNGTCVTCPVLATGIFGSSRRFDNNVNQRINLPLSTTIAGKTKFSMMFWLKPLSISGRDTIYYETLNNNNNERFVIELNSGKVRILGRNNDTNPLITPILENSTTLTVNFWHFIVINVDTTVIPSSFQIMVNNNLATGTNAAKFSNLNPNQPPVIGRSLSNTDRNLHAFIDEIAFLNNRNIVYGNTNNNDSYAFYQRGVLDLNFQVRSCDDNLCSGETFVGPNNTSSTFFRDIIDNGGSPIPGFNLTIPNNRYFQYKMTMKNGDTDIANLPLATTQVALTSVNINYTTTELTLAFDIRAEDNLNKTNVCNLQTVSVSNVVSCSYRLRIITNNNSGYTVSVLTSGSLTNGSYNIVNATNGSGGSGGNLIDSSTIGTEKYGVLINKGSITGGTINIASQYDAGSLNSVNFSNTIEQTLLTANNSNLPSPETNLTFTSLVKHNLNINQETEAGNYTQTITYRVVPNF